jgi:hypothetical protein
MRNVERSLREATEAAEELRAALSVNGEWESAKKRWLRLLTKVEDAGGVVTAEEWRRLGKEAGYTDPRGLGGFFRGQKASMRADGNDRILTDAGRNYLEDNGRVR